MIELKRINYSTYHFAIHTIRLTIYHNCQSSSLCNITFCFAIFDYWTITEAPAFYTKLQYYCLYLTGFRMKLLLQNAREYQ